MLAPWGFRDYDARWRTPEEIDARGMRAVGLGFGTQLRLRGIGDVVVGHDFRAYSPEMAGALAEGLATAGARVREIGMALTPLAYFARMRLGAGAVAMVTASHNPNGWTGVKMGFAHPFTHGAAEMAELAGIVLEGRASPAPGGWREPAGGLAEAWLGELAAGRRLARPLRVVVATGNGTAGAFAPRLIAALGAEVVPLHTALDAAFPHYNPNPEALEMLADMGAAVRASGADLALGFDGDGDRLGACDEAGAEVLSDKLGLILARGLAAAHPGAGLLLDVKSTGLFAADPVLAAAGMKVEYGRTGHSHMKRRMAETGALAGFEKSGHIYLAPPLGHGYDCALTAAVLLLRQIDGTGQGLGALVRALPVAFTSPTMSPACPEVEKRAILARIVGRIEALAAAGGRVGGRRIARIDRTDGARVTLEGGAWALVRASSNTPNLVVVCESLENAEHLRAVFADIDALVRTEPAVGPYDQSL